MSFRSFFDYPSQEQDKESENLVFLPHWDDLQWRTLLTYTSKLRVQAGQDLITIGDTDRSFYIITQGEFEVLIPSKDSTSLQRRAVREAGAVIGEQAFIDRHPRSATVRAITDADVLRLNTTAFEVFSVREPDLARDILIDLARLLSIKLRQANAFISNWVK